ncbi:flavodoxin-dependent (E)-4-hydroxy-3-methylbut-2-enyl-diphosphate synthase [Acetobacterium bakii]|uniref:4-hydroxy-3-methylbut-2-en-1-yl diphosphate synthase (flavodoxin) n=1 Tax=Acetobacterium bakii TaxID=52689 RepID=A0A0L6U2A8_9FIRM|nr:flavodoxin-dependent (E)-4-hydroxy-3-methylbut-2-enyl-diphosphate synthase [Acetobacterium bakii]KNZ42472.1 4-hydroxy-3-methylbut-2-en-1-yl diphosphate synthase [Acetobacterium bakii]
MLPKRKNSKVVHIGNIAIGGDNPIAIQSMTNTDTRDVAATVAQIKALESAGCEIIRVAVPDETAAQAIAGIKKNIAIPLVADIHFDYRLALTAMENGVDKLRINPGNIGSAIGVREIVAMARERGIPIRIGVNAGSMEKEILARDNGQATPQGMVDSAKKHIHLLEDAGFDNIVVSMKASDVRLTIESYELFAREYDYPLHLGITEAGILRTSAVKSAMGIGYLLLSGLGDTLRVSITGDPLEEIDVALDILKTIGLYRGKKKMVEIISCPTCGRTEIDLIGIAEEINRKLRHVEKNITVAVMGCIVNGPGEGRAADIGIAGGKNKAVLFKKGEIIRSLQEDEIITVLLAEIEKM